MGAANRILIVDDDPEVLELVRDLLVEQGHDVLVAPDGDEAFRLFRAAPPALALIDLRLPGRSGLELMKAMKGSRPLTEILILTAHADLGSAVEAVRAGAFDYLFKPFDIPTLVRRVDEALQRHALALEREALVAELERQLRAKTAALNQAAEERQALRAQRALDEAIRMVAGLTAGAAHDFATLLAIVKGCAQFLLESMPVGDPRRSEAERIEAAAERGRRLVQQLMAFSGASAGEPRPLDLAEIVASLMPSIRPLLGAGIKLEVRAPPGRWPIHADPQEIERLVMNLVVNARDAILAVGGSRPRGTITVDVDNLEIDEASDDPVIAGLPPGRYASLAVTDTGCGMSPEVRHRIFEPFFTTKTSGRGTGLGLATVSWIVSRYGGTIACESEPGAGSTFRVHLPCGASGAGAPAPSVPGWLSATARGG